MLLRQRPELPASLEGTELAEAVPLSQLADVLKVGTAVSLRDGSKLLKESAFGQEFLLILEGSVEVVRDGVSIAELGPGDFVGEMSLLDASYYNASVVASSDVVVMAFNRREFASVLSEAPAFGVHVRRVAESRQPA